MAAAAPGDRAGARPPRSPYLKGVGVSGAGLGPREVADAVDLAYERYRAIRMTPVDPSWDADLSFAYRAGDPDIPVDFVGVWDTVGALAIPSYVGIPDIGIPGSAITFLDVVLNPHLRHGRHAVSLDEQRGPFRPTLWRDVASRQDVEQIWFPR